MGKKLSTHYSDDNRGKAEVHADMKNESFYIKYFYNNGKRFFTEDFEGKALRYVQDAAENWAAGIKQLVG